MSWIKKEELIALLRAQQRMVDPPYLFPESRDELIPGERSITIGEAIEDAWKCAFDEAIDTVETYFEERQ